MQKVRYELDPHNRLILYTSGARGDLTGFRQVLDGRFRTDENNNLSYHVKAPLSKDTHIPHQVRLRGEWSLTDDHRLRLTLDKSGRETFGDQITLEGEILDVKENSLLFAVTTRTKKDVCSTYVLDLAGSWKADEKNRLSFHVKKEKGAFDILTFTGRWEIGKNHELIYYYERARLIRKKRTTHTLTFTGYWDIREKYRISYIVSKDSDSVFDFRTSAGICADTYIRFELGMGLTKRPHPEPRTITLFGAWKLKKDVGLTFEIEYEDRKTHAILFGADAKLTDKDTVSFRLKNDTEHKDLGVSVELSHALLKGDGQAFVRALASARELAVYAGAAWRW